MSKAHHQAGRAVMAWLHRRPIERLNLMADPDAPLPAEPEPKSEDETRERIRIHLAGPAATMIHEGGTTESHIDLGDPHVEAAALLACRLTDGDPVDVLEPELDAVLSTLRSPRVWHTVGRLAHVLRDHRSIDGKTAASVIKSAMLDPAGARTRIADHPRTIRIMPGAPPARSKEKPKPKLTAEPLTPREMVEALNRPAKRKARKAQPKQRKAKPKRPTGPMTPREVVAALQTPAKPKRRKAPRAVDRTPAGAKRARKAKARHP